MLLSNDLYQHPFAAAAVKLTVEDPLPCSEVELPVRDGKWGLAAKALGQLTLEEGDRVLTAFHPARRGVCREGAAGVPGRGLYLKE